MASITGGTTTSHVLEKLALTPFQRPDLLPSLLPLILGAIVIELYFGKYSREDLGWNTSVGNAVIWVTTGLTLVMTGTLEPLERNAAYALVGLGSMVGFMDFFHKWPSTVAFVVSSAGVVYSLAYITVVYVRTGIPINSTSLKAGLIFVVAVNVIFKIVQGLETPRDQFSFR